MYGVHVSLHISVFLFFSGVSDYLHYLYPRVGIISWYCVITSAVVYAALSIFPLIIGNCPYQTALTPPLQFCTRLLLFFGRTIWLWLWRCQKVTFPGRKERHFDRSHFLVEQANVKAAHLDSYAMEWLFTDNDFSETNMDRFLEGLPGYIHSHFTVPEDLPKVLAAPYIFRRIKEHLITGATETELSAQACVTRVSACVDSRRVLLRQYRTSIERAENPGEEKLLRGYMQSIVDGLTTLCGKPDEIRDRRAFCVRALAFQGFLTKCLEPVELSPSANFPDHFHPM